MSGKKILDGAHEALDWVRGFGTMRVTLPEQPAREMTFAEYAHHENLRQLREAGVTLSRTGNEVRIQFPEGAEIDRFYDELEAALAPQHDGRTE